MFMSSLADWDVCNKQKNEEGSAFTPLNLFRKELFNCNVAKRVHFNSSVWFIKNLRISMSLKE